MYVLFDCNNFYASAERLFKPGLRGLPIVVLSNNDGCVIARSEEAEVAGIKMGDPAFLVHDLIKKFNIQVFSSNYVLYGDMSERVMHNLTRWFSSVIPYSIDEAFAWAGDIPNLKNHAKEARKSIIKNTGIPVSIGIAPTKTHIMDPDVLCEAVTTYASRLAEKLRCEAMCCQFLEVFLLTNKHREDHPQHYPKHTHRLSIASNSTTDIVAIANKVARMLFNSGIKYRKAGVIATGLIPEGDLQFHLFKAHSTGGDDVSAVMDKLNMAYGRGTLRMASEDFEKKWKLKHEYLSGGYTTRWEDLIKVR